MLSNLVVAATLISTALGGVVPSAVQPLNQSYPAETPNLPMTIGQYIEQFPPDANAGGDISPHVMVTEQKRSVKQFSSLWVSYKNKDRNGYNLTLSGGICANAKVGQFIAPNGTAYPQATFADVYQAIARESASGLRTHISTQAKAAHDSLTTLLKTRICDPPARSDRELLDWNTVTKEDRDGYWTATVINGVGGAAIALGGIYAAISTNINKIEEASILTAVGAIEYLLYRIIDRLQVNRQLSSSEALVMNCAIIASNFVVNSFKSCGHGTCQSAAAFQSGLKDLFVFLSDKLQYVCSCCGDAGVMAVSASTVNLVAQGGDPSSHGGDMC